MKAIVATHFLRSNIRQIVNLFTSESKSSQDDNPGVFGRGSYKVALAVLNLLCIPGWGGGGVRELPAASPSQAPPLPSSNSILTKDVYQRLLNPNLQTIHINKITLFFTTRRYQKKKRCTFLLPNKTCFSPYWSEIVNCSKLCTYWTRTYEEQKWFFFLKI